MLSLTIFGRRSPTCLYPRGFQWPQNSQRNQAPAPCHLQFKTYTSPQSRTASGNAPWHHQLSCIPFRARSSSPIEESQEVQLQKFCHCGRSSAKAFSITRASNTIGGHWHVAPFPNQCLRCGYWIHSHCSIEKSSQHQPHSKGRKLLMLKSKAQLCVTYLPEWSREDVH